MLASDASLVSKTVVDSLSRLEMQFRVSPIRLRVTGEATGVRRADGRPMDLHTGEVVELERWVGEELAGAGLAEPLEEPITPTVLNRLRWLEGMAQGEALRPLPDAFYPRARRLLRAEGETGLLRQAILDVVSGRIRKIIRLASVASIPREAGAAMQPEDAVLYDAVRTCISAWRDAVLGVG